MFAIYEGIHQSSPHHPSSFRYLGPKTNHHLKMLLFRNPRLVFVVCRFMLSLLLFLCVLHEQYGLYFKGKVYSPCKICNSPILEPTPKHRLQQVAQQMNFPHDVQKNWSYFSGLLGLICVFIRFFSSCLKSFAPYFVLTILTQTQNPLSPDLSLTALLILLFLIQCLSS